MPKGRRRKPPAVPRSLLTAGAVAVAVLAGTVWFFFIREGALLVPDFSFKLGKVGGRQAGETTAPREEIEDAAEEVRSTLDDLYVGGFLDPSEWRGGRFPGVFDAFYGPAVKKAQRDLPVLTLGPEAAQIEYMTPRFGRLHVRFLVDDEGSLISAVATTAFAAQGELQEGGPVLAQHQGTWFMRPLEDRWLIAGYRARGTVGPGELPPRKATPA